MTVAVAWRFSQLVVAERVAASEYPELASYSDYAEGLPVFLETPPV
ncbi:glutathione S-transferase [Pseudomonas aeruginosa]|nr:glutathione S-transferase [Pseudomonas aeruginosa]